MKFYVLEMDLFNDKEYCYGEQFDHNTGETLKCEVCGHALGSREWLPPHTVQLSKPKYGDMVIGTFNTFLVSEKFKLAYEESGLKGIYEFQPVIVKKVSRRRKTDDDLPNYYYALVKISKAKIDVKHSKFDRDGHIECQTCLSGGIINGIKKIVLDIKEWEQEDVFRATGLAGEIFVSEKFVAMTKKYNLTNIKFIPIEEYTWDALGDIDFG